MTRERPPYRPRGVPLLVGLVVIGFAAGAGYYGYLQPRVKADVDAQLAAAPSTAEGRLALWAEYVEPIVIERMRQARISRQQPWIVTHVVDDRPGEPPEVWGIESEGLAAGLVLAEGLEVRVTLPAPRALARAELVGDHARSVLRVGPGEPVPDAAERLGEIADYALRFQREKLEQDIEGATLVVEVARPGNL